MITNKKELKFYLSEEKKFYFKKRKYIEIIKLKICKDSNYVIWKFIRLLRKEEYYYNTRRKLLYLITNRRKNKLGIKLGFEIPKNTCGYGLKLYHFGPIIINKFAKLGNNIVLHGNNCIGNTQNNNSNVPIIGDNCEFGFGAVVIGKIIIGNNTIIGANAVVNKSFSDSSILVGIPANKLDK